VTLYKQDFISIADSIFLGLVDRCRGPLGDLFESGVKRDMQVKDSGRLLAGTEECSTASTRRSSPS
jgi:CDP-diglyceride synthetase